MEPFWLEIAKRIQAIAQSGLAYCKDPFDRERYRELREISACMVSRYSETSMKRVRELFLNETGYQTPKIDVRAVILQDQHILLVKERSDGNWTLPGGWAEPGLSLGENIVKEVKEESGYEVEAERILAILDRNRYNHPPSPYSIYKIFVLARLIGGQPSSSIETEAAAFYPVDHLPDLSTERITGEQIQMMIQLAASGKTHHD
ncbi:MULTISPECIES: NUDIX hydrolase [unclassified Thermoactinomyces]|uniref:NUDIX hydrolase n=1 Tax=unclassified Thermoactinomyces TaxID=2634588 RepID=UPI0018DB0E86|nr:MULTISPECIES: NUDIX hydrolase [unclassified Thermoactinomyces]MBH8599209.1 NUDIX hydrolase [Thermoactinomyces sp. CICC 10523]MBH8609297.1 NUDIX hydrolase [Thermoactinomyces sp. CICC 10521]